MSASIFLCAVFEKTDIKFNLSFIRKVCVIMDQQGQKFSYTPITSITETCSVDSELKVLTEGQI